MPGQSFLGLPPIPAELKPITSFIQRADELKIQDPVIAYWCAYCAAQEGISLKAPAPANRKFLSELLTALESLRATIGPSDAIDVEAVSTVYVEDFALRVFNVADTEDRNGKATRSTAKKFLAAATFLDVLRVFEDKRPWESHADKARYAKWKAADIARAFREGRMPNPGPAGSNSTVTDASSSTPFLPEVPSPHILPSAPSSTASVPTVNTPAMSSVSSAPSVPHAASANTFDRSAGDLGVWSTTSTVGDHTARATSAAPEEDCFYGSPPSRRRHTPPSTAASPLPPVGEEHASGHGGPPSPPSSTGSGSTSSKQRRSRAGSLSVATPPVLPSFSKTNQGRKRTSSMSSTSSRSGRSTRSVNRPASPTHFVPRDSPLSPNPPLVQSSQTTPAVSPNATGYPIYRPSQPFSAPSGSPQASAPPVPPPAGLPYASAPLLPSAAPYAYVAPPPPPPPPKQPSPPPELTPSIIAKAQKHCRFAISALDYEDAEQARKELRAALQLLGDV